MSDNGFTIEQGIPLPAGKNRKMTPLTEALGQMKVGDSIVIPKGDRNKAISSANYRGKRLATRAINATEVRIWVVEARNRQ